MVAATTTAQAGDELHGLHRGKRLRQNRRRQKDRVRRKTPLFPYSWRIRIPSAPQSEPEKSSCRVPACFLLMPARRLIAFHRSDSRPRWSGEVHLRSRLDKLRLARPLEERESRTSLPRLRPPQSDPVLQRHVVDSRHQRFVLLLALPMPRKIPQVRARSKNHIDPRDRRNLFRVFHADGRSEEHTSELQSHHELVCRLLLEKKKLRVRER